MLINRIKLQNVLSFGPNAQELELKPLNVLIGPNGSGKSNFIEVIGLLQAAPWELTTPIGSGGGVSQWLWQGKPGAASAYVEAILNNPNGPPALRHCFGFAEQGHQLQLIGERIETEEAYPGHSKPYIFFELKDGRAVLNYREGQDRQLRYEGLNPQQSILAQRKDPHHYPELTWIGDKYQ